MSDLFSLSSLLRSFTCAGPRKAPTPQLPGDRLTHIPPARSPFGAGCSSQGSPTIGGSSLESMRRRALELDYEIAHLRRSLGGTNDGTDDGASLPPATPQPGSTRSCSTGGASTPTTPGMLTERAVMHVQHVVEGLSDRWRRAPAPEGASRYGIIDCSKLSGAELLPPPPLPAAERSVDGRGGGGGRSGGGGRGVGGGRGSGATGMEAPIDGRYNDGGHDGVYGGGYDGEYEGEYEDDVPVPMVTKADGGGGGPARCTGSGPMSCSTARSRPLRASRGAGAGDKYRITARCVQTAGDPKPIATPAT